MDNKAIIRNFSRCAATYDNYADVQNKAAGLLLEMTRSERPEDILEIGCGTGNYTLLLRERFKDARIRAVDISEGMIRVAREKIKDEKTEFVTADAQDLSLKQEFDLITSSSCFQWFRDLGSAFEKYKCSLKKGGEILFSSFGPDTFRELDFVLKSVLKKATASCGFSDAKTLETLLDKDFKGAEITELRHQETFSCLEELLNKIRHTGARGRAEANGLLFSRKLLARLEEAYIGEFKEVKATYQIFLCKANAR